MKKLIHFLCSIAILFSLQTQAVSLNEALQKQQKAAASERKFANKQLTESAKNVLSLIQVKNAEDDRCTIGGGSCYLDSQCCSDNCRSGTCQAGAGGCSIGGSSCYLDSQCCSDNCRSGTCQEGSGGCSDGGGSCYLDSQCCSGNCRSGTCQTACSTSGDSCTYDHECCAGNCNSRGECGADLPPNCY